MKEYEIKETNNKEIIIKFLFDSSSTIISFVFSVFLFVFLFFKIRLVVLGDIWIYLIILFVLLMYLTFNKFYEWNRDKYHKLTIKGGGLLINDKFFCDISNIKSINISYSVNQFESGWTVYLNRYLNSQSYIIKRRLTEKDALIIAEKLSSFFDKPLIMDN
ncbi:hypothetical protein BZL53_14500 [Flavobacterium columnare]|uniref:Uncharacterized protein n=1 Tax=Flavobacterium columnare (strain ATCC 49512 / CIP 103533 / TG 44/87) TaxID=1041826 RepID=G8X4X2_FLACA|nr:hypothetical protein [Flavobacterium columnare]AEW86788.1 hypothetical protein FCOL_09895 [Flavobacterium columnare ATCC 49512]OOB81711.1 hypothetical protein BZL53_14500 [Flavobacterium columnare]